LSSKVIKPLLDSWQNERTLRGAGRRRASCPRLPVLLQRSSPSTNMSDTLQQIRKSSPAFVRALLESERLRIRIVIAVILAAFVIRSLRTAVVFSHESLSLWATTSLFMAILVVYELWMLHVVKQSIVSGRDLSSVTWIMNILIETCIPALALVFLSTGAIEAA